MTVYALLYKQTNDSTVAENLERIKRKPCTGNKNLLHTEAKRAFLR